MKKMMADKENIEHCVAMKKNPRLQLSNVGECSIVE